MERNVELIFTGHAVNQLFERGIRRQDVRAAFDNGEVITEYPDDKPLPSQLRLFFIEERPLHVVFALDAEKRRAYVVTAYWPDPARWQPDFKRRRSV